MDKAPLVLRPVFIQPHLPPSLRPSPAPGAPLVTLTLPPCPLPLTSGSARNREGQDFVASWMVVRFPAKAGSIL